jgi:hypothetical protein
MGVLAHVMLDFGSDLRRSEQVYIFFTPAPNESLRHEMKRFTLNRESRYFSD